MLWGTVDPCAAIPLPVQQSPFLAKQAPSNYRLTGKITPLSTRKSHRSFQAAKLQSLVTLHLDRSFRYVPVLHPPDALQAPQSVTLTAHQRSDRTGPMNTTLLSPAPLFFLSLALLSQRAFAAAAAAAATNCTQNPISVELWSLKALNSTIRSFPVSVLDQSPLVTARIPSLFVQALPGVNSWWGFLSAESGADLDTYFAARFTTQFCVPNDRAVEFRATSDDGSLLYLDGTELVSMDTVQSITAARSGVVSVTAGCRRLVFLTFQNEAASLAKVEVGFQDAESGEVPSFQVLQEGDLLLSAEEDCVLEGVSVAQDKEGEVDQCSFPTDSRSCDDTTAHWFFNKHTGFCEKVAHGGCRTTNPGFQSEEECNVQCVAPVNPWKVPKSGSLDCVVGSTAAIINNTCHCKEGFKGSSCQLNGSSSSGTQWLGITYGLVILVLPTAMDLP